MASKGVAGRIVPLPWRVAAAVAWLLLVVGAPTPLRAADNSPPVAVDDPSTACGFDVLGGSFPIPEDWRDWFVLGAGACSPLANDYDPDGDPLTVELVGQPGHGDAIGLSDGLLAYRVEPDYSTRAGNVPGGTWVSTTITYRLFDGTAYSNDAVYRLWIAPVNDAPTFAPGPDLVEAVAGGGPVNQVWATSISPGPGNESYQTVSFEILSVDQAGAPGMFSSLPVIDDDGVLRFTPGPEPGLATVTVRARDSGGLESYYGLEGSHEFPAPADRSEPVSFQIAVHATPPSAAPSSSASPRPSPVQSPVPTPTIQPSSAPQPGPTSPSQGEPPSSLTPEGSASASQAPEAPGFPRRPAPGTTGSPADAAASPASSAPAVGSTDIPGVGRAGSTTSPAGPGGDSTAPDAAMGPTAAARRDGVVVIAMLLTVGVGLAVLAALGIRMRRQR